MIQPLLDKTLESILKHHQPALEPEVQEYLTRFLAEADNADDSEGVQSLLQEFLTEDDCQSILQHFLSESGEASSSPTRTSLHEKSTREQPTRLLLSPKSDLSPERTKDNDASKEDAPSPKSKKALRKERQQQKREKKYPAPEKEIASTTAVAAELLDDHASAWKECQDEGKLWGGRGHGGRGIRYTGENLQSIHLPSVSLSFEGNELLVDSPMDILQGHRYGLLGRNGVGKSTLLKQLARNGIPGMPRSMRILLVQQQIQGRDDQTTLEALVQADVDRLHLLQEQEQVEAHLEAGESLVQNVERLGVIVAELDAIDADGADDRALTMLKGLSFTKEMIRGPTCNLSGGWRMRLALAQALFIPHSDLILLDECTNHLDLQGMDW